MNEKVFKIINYIKKFVILNKTLSTRILAGLIILITIIIIATCFNSREYGNTTGNSNNLGLAVQDGNWIYYVELDDDETVGISKVKNNGKKTAKVVEGNMCYLSIMDNYIYCLEYDEDESQNNLIKIKTNGKNKKILARDIDEKQITAVDNWIYYYKNDKLYRINQDGTDKIKVSDKSISYYQIDGKWIYYIYEKENSQYIAKMKLDGTDTQKIAKAEASIAYETLYIKGSKIYYIASETNDDYDYDSYLYKMNKNGEKIEKVCKIDKNIKDINMQEDAIYYTVTNDYSSYTIKSIKYNGTDKTTIKKTKSAIGINVFEDWIIFMDMNEDYETVIQMISKNGEKIRDL